MTLPRLCGFVAAFLFLVRPALAHATITVNAKAGLSIVPPMRVLLPDDVLPAIVEDAVLEIPNPLKASHDAWEANAVNAADSEECTVAGALPFLNAAVVVGMITFSFSLA